jgi:hypothetical protein
VFEVVSSRLALKVSALEPPVKEDPVLTPVVKVNTC